MKHFFVLICLITVSISAKASNMVRVSSVPDSHTIVLESGASVRLRSVDIPPDEESVAREYLQHLVLHQWVYVDNGDVYRSPDALFVNGEMARRAYHHAGPAMIYLGEAHPGQRSDSTSALAIKAASKAARVRPRVFILPRRPARTRRQAIRDLPPLPGSR